MEVPPYRLLTYGRNDGATELIDPKQGQILRRLL